MVGFERETLQYCGVITFIVLSACVLVSTFSIAASESSLLYQIAAVTCWYVSMLFVTTYPLHVMQPELVSDTLRMVVIGLFAIYLSVTEIWLTLESNEKVARSFGTVQQIGNQSHTCTRRARARAGDRLACRAKSCYGLQSSDQCSFRSCTSCWRAPRRVQPAPARRRRSRTSRCWAA
jgi:hypothetical protein